jgi:hypothetical protein
MAVAVLLALHVIKPIGYYNQIRLGMTEEEVTAVFGREPDERNGYNPSELAYIGGVGIKVRAQCWWHFGANEVIGVAFDENGRAVHRFINTPFHQTGEPSFFIN